MAHRLLLSQSIIRYISNIETFLNKYKVIAFLLLLHIRHYMQGILWKIFSTQNGLWVVTS